METYRIDFKAISGLEDVRIIETEEGMTTVFIYSDEASAAAAVITVQSFLGKFSPLMNAPLQ